jgi:hypothetical protein
MEGPARVVFEPIEHVVGIVGRKIIAYNMPLALGMTEVGEVEQLDEREGIMVFGQKSKELSIPNIISAHEGESPMTDILIFTPKQSTRGHRLIGVLSF